MVYSLYWKLQDTPKERIHFGRYIGAYSFNIFLNSHISIITLSKDIARILQGFGAENFFFFQHCSIALISYSQRMKKLQKQDHVHCFIRVILTFKGFM